MLEMRLEMRVCPKHGEQIFVKGWCPFCVEEEALQIEPPFRPKRRDDLRIHLRGAKQPTVSFRDCQAGEEDALRERRVNGEK